MKFLVNGKPVELNKVTFLTELLEKLGYTSQFVAVAVNRKCIPRTQQSGTKLQESDEIEILSPQAGG